MKVWDSFGPKVSVVGFGEGAAVSFESCHTTSVVLARTTTKSRVRESVKSIVSVVSRRLRTVRIMWTVAPRSKAVGHVAARVLQLQRRDERRVVAAVAAVVAGAAEAARSFDVVVPAQITRMPSRVAGVASRGVGFSPWHKFSPRGTTAKESS